MPAGNPPLHDPAFHAGDPFPAFRSLRDREHLHWHDTPGFWAVARHEHVVAVSRDPETFCSSRGTLLSDLERPIMPRQSIIYIDPPEHAKYRKLVQPAFTPGRVRALEQWIRQKVGAFLDALPAGEPFDFVDAVAAPLPLQVIAEMLGVADADREQFKRWSDAVVDAATTPTPENAAEAAALLTYFSTVLAERRGRPGDDVLSALVQAEIDGERLEEFDLLMFCMTLLVAGNETTRNLLSHGALALATHPEALAALRQDRALLPLAVEEMLRWGSPISSFMRTVTRDAELGGTRIREGDRLLLFYVSANRDERVFGADAEAFRVTRDATRHVAFGFGEHFCLGATLARMEGRIAFEEITTRFPRIALAGDVERLPSLLIRGIVRLPLVLSA